MKKLIIYFIITIITVTNINQVYAQTPTVKDYDVAVENGDINQIIKYGVSYINSLKGSKFNRNRANVIAPMIENIGLSYEKQGNYKKAMEYFRLYIPLGEALNLNDSVKYMQSKIDIYEGSQIRLFTDAEYPPYFGALNEPEGGIMFGKPVDTFEKFTPDKECSIISAYCQFKIDELNLPYKIGDKTLLLNWNIDQVNDYAELNNVENSTVYITQQAKIMKEYDKPILLRFGGEMNVWEPKADPKVFKKAFIKVASIMHKYAPNVAMVWSPNDISASSVKLEDYYPGDGYVDWIGASSYTTKYFLGRNNWGDQTDVLQNSFFCGKYANPITRLNELREIAKDKPIIITEGGIGYSNTPAKDVDINFAKKWLEFQYVYLPMMVPEVKAIVHFDVDRPQSAHHFELYKNKELMNTYNNAVNQKYYISTANEESKGSYEPLNSKKDK